MELPDHESVTQVLVLTHRGIARELGYSNLLAAYSKLSFGNDRLMKGEDAISDALKQIEGAARAYEDKRYGDFLRVLGGRGINVKKHEDKTSLRTYMDGLEQVRLTGTIGEVFDYMESQELIPLPDRLGRLQTNLAEMDPEDPDRQAKKQTHYDAVRSVAYTEYIAFTAYVEEHTPFSTKHSVKGAEFKNVLVVIDDVLWNKYKFSGVFLESDTSDDRLERSRRLIYVCLSRAMDGLAMLYLNPPSAQASAAAQQLLGSDSVTSLD